MKTFEYGAMSSRYSVEAENKLTAYVAMVCHYDTNAHLLILYEPEEIKKDTWVDFTGKISGRLDEIFIENSGMDFDKYCESHLEEIKACYKTIKQLV